MDDSIHRREMDEYLRKLHALPCYQQLLAHQGEMEEYLRTLRSLPVDQQGQSTSSEHAHTNR